MEKLFAIPFCTTLITLAIVNNIKNLDGILLPLIILFIGLFISFLTLRYYTFSILLISIAISLLAGQKFITMKRSFYQKKELNVCSDDYVKIRGRVLQFPLLGNGTSTLLVNVISLNDKQNMRNNEFTLKIIVKGNLRDIFMGDLIEIYTTIKNPRPPENFFPSRSEIFLLANNIHFSGYSKSALLVERIRRSNILMQFTGWIRERCRSLIEKKYLEKNGDLKCEGQMLEALLLGDRGRLSPEVKEMLLQTGIFHLFAISGAHIGIIALFTLFLLNKTSLKQRKKYIILIFVLLFFLVLTGFKISAQRAVIMAVLISISKILYLRSDAINIISFTGLILLLKDPRYFLDPGFILTFTITAGIISGRKIFFRDSKNKNSYIREMAVANINASIISMPLSLFYFLRYSFTGLIAGMLLLPLTAIIMCMSLPLIPLSVLPHFFSIPVIALADIPLKIFFFLAESFSKTLDLTIFRAPPNPFLLLLFLMLFFFLSNAGQGKTTRILSALLIFIAYSIMIIKPPPYNPQFPEIYFLDVGQGDSHIVVLPGGDSLLIDGGGAKFGNFETGKQIVLPFILKQGIKIKWVAVSHYHADHCRGINEIVKILRPEEVWISSSPEESFLYKNLINNCSGITRIRKISSGFQIRGSGTEIKFLFPLQFLHPLHTNNNHSQVIKISGYGYNVLFTGDIETETEEELIRVYGRELKCNILKVPHHGSNTSSTTGFLEMTDPDYAIFPLGYKNSFNFPDKKVIKRYKLHGTKLLYTSEHGGIRAVLDPGGIIFSVSRFGKNRGVNF